LNVESEIPVKETQVNGPVHRGTSSADRFARFAIRAAVAIKGGMFPAGLFVFIVLER
jgi:hypothetical protein